MAPPLVQGYAPPAQYAQAQYAPPAQPKPPGWLIPLAIGGSALVVGVMLAATVFIVLPAASGAKPGSSSSEEPNGTRSDSSSEVIPEGDDGRRAFGPDAPVLESDGTITEQLQAMQDSYKAQYDDGSLWKLMPKTDENRGAYQAFRMLIADMKGATLFGTSVEDNLYYSQEARYLEARFLAEEPLGSSVTYTNSEGRTFKYNGDTGEVSFE